MSSTAPIAVRQHSAPQQIADNLSAKERVAIILSLLEPDQAKSIAGRIDPLSVENVISAYEDMRNVPRHLLLKVIADFITELKNKNPRVRGGTKQAAMLADLILEKPTDSAAQSLDEVGSIADGAEPDAVWSYLEQMETSLLARLIDKERAAVIAAILNRLNEDKSGEILSALPTQKAVIVVQQMAQGSPLPPPTMDAIAESLRQQANSTDLNDTTGEDYSPVPRLTSILNRCPASLQDVALQSLKTHVSDTAEAIEGGLIRFGTLPDLLPRNVAPILFRELDDDILKTSLRYGRENAAETVDYLYANISQRLAEQIRETVDRLELPTEEEGEASQSAVISKLLAWEKEGRFTFNKK